MSHYEIKRNERDWAGQLISWLKKAIADKTTVFQDATNDTSVRMESGRTKFPDILLFTDKLSGIVFNGWELKFPDTAVDNTEMLQNALEKAKKLNANSFVTWNGTEAIIWGIDTEHYSVETLHKIKHYPKVPTISTRDDLATASNFRTHEPLLQQRALEILHDLDQLYRNGELRPAINVSHNIITAIRIAHNIIIPQFTNAIEHQVGESRAFREAFNQWKIYESATLKILGSSSRHAESVNPQKVLAKFTFYNLIGKILFYLTLSENLSGELAPISLSPKNVKSQLEDYFNKATQIDYQAIFKPYFTDILPFSETTDSALYTLLQSLCEFDFKLLPTNVIGTILENLVPDDEKLKFGQYFTPATLANLAAFPAVEGRNALLLDPTSGTGTFLNAFYSILSYFGNNSHQQKLSQIWGNDVSHFPSILSVINLYKQDVTETDNFPRVLREDFFNLEPNTTVKFPDPYDHNQKIAVPIPKFDGIASNFPFIQQEDIPNDKLTGYFRQKFELKQAAFLNNGDFKINERADYFTYCIYNSIRFLKDGGIMSAITSNAWLGKDYGLQFKTFLLDNFHIKYIVRSIAEHWFSNSQVSTIYFVLEKRNDNNDPTKFVTLNFKLNEFFTQDNIARQIEQIENLYCEFDNCDNPANTSWHRDPNIPERYINNNQNISVTIIPCDTLHQSIIRGTNWEQFFIAANPLSIFDPFVTQYHSRIFNVIRGERTGWNPMFIIPESKLNASRIDQAYLMPYVKSPSELTGIEFPGTYSNYAFVCNRPQNALDHGTQTWINRFVNELNKNGSLTIPQACASHKPYWYSLSPKTAHIVTAINPYERFFFTYSCNPFIIDQRMIAMQVQPGYDIELIAALLNSVATFLTLELAGTSRNLGTLDLNAGYLKTIRLLNPDLLSDEHKTNIKTAFAPLKHRPIATIFEEVTKPDRCHFDRTVLKAFGINENILPHLYRILIGSVRDRCELKDR